MNRTNILKRILIAGLMLASTSTVFAADVGVSISVGQPGFYGQIDIGDYPYPQPRVIYREPIIVHRHVEVYEPMYLRVPPGHYKNWKRYCNRYNACGRQVTSFKTAGIATTSHLVIANVIVTIIVETMMTTVETIMTTNVAMVTEKVKISTKR